MTDELKAPTPKTKRLSSGAEKPNCEELLTSGLEAPTS
jgi:hypothetical protein